MKNIGQKPVLPKPLLLDKRLLGEWRSDKQRTVAEWSFRKRLSPKRRAFFLNLFGKLRVRYTPTRIISQLNEYVQKNRYQVVARNSYSVAIVHDHEVPLSGDWTIYHIHFEGKDRYWIPFGGNREWFKRVRSTKPRGKISR